MVIRVKPVSKFIILTLTLLLLLSSSITVRSSDHVVSDEPESEQSDDLDELLAVDEEGTEGNQEQQSEAEVVSKAQRIVLELNIDSAKRVIDGNEYVMVLGYAPWCPRSAELMPQFAEAATILKEIGSPLLMAKVDADRYPKVASQLEIKGFPTLLLFTNGSSQPYAGGFSAEDIVLWARKKTGVPVIRIETIDEANEFLKRHHMFVLGLFDKFEGSSHEQFVKAAALDDDIQFVETKNTEAAKVLYPDIKGSSIFVGIVKSEPERYTAFEGPYETEKILQFLDGNKFPLVTRLTETNSAKVYSGTLKTQVMIFAKADDFEKLVQPLEDIARKFKAKIMLIYIEIANENLAMPFLTLFGMENSTNIVVAAFDTKENKKFLLESESSARNIDEFCSGFLDGTVSPYYKSQPIPDNTNTSVLTVVGKTLDEAVLSNSKNVLLEVYMPWCLNCETVSKKVEKVAKHFKGLDSLVFARIDASVNEHPKLQVDDYPTVLLFKSGEKDNPIRLSTKSSSKDMAVFINKELKQKDQITKDEL